MFAVIQVKSTRLPRFNKRHKLDRPSIRSSPRYGLSTPYSLTKEQCNAMQCSYLQGPLVLVLKLRVWGQGLTINNWVIENNLFRENNGGIHSGR